MSLSYARQPGPTCSCLTTTTIALSYVRQPGQPRGLPLLPDILIFLPYPLIFSHLHRGGSGGSRRFWMAGHFGTFPDIVVWLRRWMFDLHKISFCSRVQYGPADEAGLRWLSTACKYMVRWGHLSRKGAAVSGSGIVWSKISGTCGENELLQVDRTW